MRQGGRRANDLTLFWSRVDKRGPVSDYAPELGPCWIWTHNLDRDGYGRFQYKGKTRRAHQVAYVAIVGPRPAGLVPDHLCRVRNCVNPAHLEWVTDRENILRGEGLASFNAAKTHCVRGHELSTDNLYVYGNQRVCKTCLRVREEKYRTNVPSVASADHAEPAP